MSYNALVVDDDVASRFIYQQILSTLGFAVEAVGDGAVAYDLLQRCTYDLIFLDMLLPRVGGAEILHYIHNAPHLETTTVVVVSAHINFRDPNTLGPRDQFLLKPVLANTIRAVARDVIAARQST